MEGSRSHADRKSYLQTCKGKAWAGFAALQVQAPRDNGAKEFTDAAFENGCHDDRRVRYRNWLSSINDDSGAWLSAGVSPKMFEMSNNKFVSAVCRRSTVEDPTIPQYTTFISRGDPQMFRCACGGGSHILPPVPQEEPQCVSTL